MNRKKLWAGNRSAGAGTIAILCLRCLPGTSTHLCPVGAHIDAVGVAAVCLFDAHSGADAKLPRLIATGGDNTPTPGAVCR